MKAKSKSKSVTTTSIKKKNAAKRKHLAKRSHNYAKNIAYLMQSEEDETRMMIAVT
jgi:hypothetical protein